MKQRLQKIISSAGICSRRKSEELIAAGRVLVNGAAAAVGDSADPELDTICVDGAPLSFENKKTYIMLNKPRGFVCTLSDEKGRRCVTELVSALGVRLYPVGRLDMYSEGLLVMTNDGEFANLLAHPSSETKKFYQAYIRGVVSEASLGILRGSMNIDGYIISPAEVSVLEFRDGVTKLEIVIHEGRNRQIRKMCAMAGVKLIRLVRTGEGPLRLGDLGAGEWRHLTESELQALTRKRKPHI